MPINIKIGEGVTEPQAFILKTTTNGVTSAADITGYASVAFYARPEDNAGDEVSRTTGDGDISVTDASAGELAVTFGEADLLFSVGSYLAYFIVVDGTGKRIRFPVENDYIKITVLERFTIDA